MFLERKDKLWVVKIKRAPIKVPFIERETVLTIKDFFKSHNIEAYSLIPLARCKVLREYLLSKNGLDKDCHAIMMLFPYRSEKAPKNLTVYASVKDYHGYVESFSKELESFLRNRHPNGIFKVFSDHSPIDEVHACCISGLGFIGDNGLLITEKYSSFVFLGECITNVSPEELGLEIAPEIQVRGCLHCGKCKSACPSCCIGEVVDKKKDCLSAITQKKGILTDEEVSLMVKNGSIWGCDICQNVCPYTKNASFTPIDYFKNDVIECLDLSTLEGMSDEDFSSRPFAWRGMDTIKRNVLIYEEKMKGAFDK